jgi:hypothetical protein
LIEGNLHDTGVTPFSSATAIRALDGTF